MTRVGRLAVDRLAALADAQPLVIGRVSPALLMTRRL